MLHFRVGCVATRACFRHDVQCWWLPGARLCVTRVLDGGPADAQECAVGHGELSDAVTTNSHRDGLIWVPVTSNWAASGDGHLAAWVSGGLMLTVA